MSNTTDDDVWATDEDMDIGERIDWADIAEKITSNPGEWLLAKRRGSRSFIYKINNGQFAKLLVDGFVITAASRNHRNGRSDIWVKAERA